MQRYDETGQLRPLPERPTESTTASLIPKQPSGMA
jgi:hypothetical protein